MRLYNVVCNIAIAIYQFTPDSCPLITPKHRTVIVRLIEEMTEKGSYSILTDALALIQLGISSLSGWYDIYKLSTQWKSGGIFIVQK